MFVAGFGDLAGYSSIRDQLDRLIDLECGLLLLQPLFFCSTGRVCSGLVDGTMTSNMEYFG